jgi:mannose-1-phosphate guanylyltransferase
MPNGMILAAGLGTRLRPLTNMLPKPLLPVANRPVMAYGIQRLQAAGITCIGANASYRAVQILETFGDGHAAGVHLHWSVESSPTGTAGGLKGLQRVLDDDLVVVVAGDAMLDIDLVPLLTAHRERGAFATLATVPVADPSQYGVVVTDADGHIVQFQEKPAPGTEISRQANTGIYIFDPGIFDLIAADTFVDFALHIFPEVLRRRLPFIAMSVHGYWTDVGNPGDYLQANLDALAGRIAIDLAGHAEQGSCVAATAAVAGSRLHRCIIGEGARLAAGCVLHECVVWPDTHVPDPLQLTQAILTPWGVYALDGKTADERQPASLAW